MTGTLELGLQTFQISMRYVLRIAGFLIYCIPCGLSIYVVVCPSSFRDHYVPTSTNVGLVHQSNKNRCTGCLSARETVAAHATAIFAVTFFLHLDLKNIPMPHEQILSYPVLHLLFNIFGKIKKIEWMLVLGAN
jgi:hypothetical protein